VTAEIRRAAGRSSVVLVARHPTASLPLPAGPAWRIAGGAVRIEDRAADAVSVMEVETGDGQVHQVSELELADVLRAALDAGLSIRRVQPVAVAPVAEPVPGPETGQAGDPEADPLAAPAADAPRRAGGLHRIYHGAAHRARLLTVSQWFAAPALLFLIILGIFYAKPVGPLLPAAAFTAVLLVPVMIWVSVQAHLADGRLMARAFAAHVGGMGRAQLAACLATVPFAVAATAIAVGWSALTQPHPRHPPHYPGLLVDMITLHLAAAVFGVGVGALLVPPLVERAGWRICLAVGLFLALLLVPVSPMHPLLLLATHPAGESVGAAAGLIAATGAALIGVTAFLASRLP
jgi:hypothetical protein